MQPHGWLSTILLLAMSLPPFAAVMAREVSVETRFDDAAAYPPLRLIEERSESRRFDEDAVRPLREVDDDPDGFDDEWQDQSGESFVFHVLPKGLLYRSYLAGEKEPRFNSVWLKETGRGLVWETQMGGRIGILGREFDGGKYPRQWQFDMEGGAQTRVDPQQNSDLEAADFRFGLLSTWRFGRNSFKVGYYHLSSHAGDEYLLRTGFARVNYVRDSAIVGWTHDLTENMQIYGEIGYAAGHEGGAKPIELQYGYQYSPLYAYGLKGAPYFGINGHTREDFNWITSINTVAGWQWRGEESNHLFRAGFQYYTGPALQWEFTGRQNETFGGAGLWFDY